MGYDVIMGEMSIVSHCTWFNSGQWESCTCV